MAITLTEVLNLVGKLDDSPGVDTARERFRHYLIHNLQDVGQIRDYVEEGLRTSGDQYSRSLQDLVNLIGRFLGFEVEFGRYQGVKGQVGFDGVWKSPTGFQVVAEVKTTEVYSIKTSVLMNYVNELISSKRIATWDNALGLYVIGRADPEIRNLENAITAEKNGDQLRIISVDALLSLAELMKEYDVRHQDVLAVIRPSGPKIDPVIDLMTRLVARGGASESTPSPAKTVEGAVVAQAPTISVVERSAPGEGGYWLTPVKADEHESAEECVQRLVGEASIYAFGERAPSRTRLKTGDWLCFYATGKGVIAHACVTGAAEKKTHPKVRHAEQYPWIIKLSEPRLYIEQPVIIDADMRARLDAFAGRDLSKAWAWFVQTTSRLTQHDFELLTRR